MDIIKQISSCILLLILTGCMATTTVTRSSKSHIVTDKNPSRLEWQQQNVMIKNTHNRPAPRPKNITRMEVISAVRDAPIMPVSVKPYITPDSQQQSLYINKQINDMKNYLAFRQKYSDIQDTIDQMLGQRRLNEVAKLVRTKVNELAHIDNKYANELRDNLKLFTYTMYERYEVVTVETITRTPKASVSDGIFTIIGDIITTPIDIIEGNEPFPNTSKMLGPPKTETDTTRKRFFNKKRVCPFTGSVTSLKTKIPAKDVKL